MKNYNIDRIAYALQVELNLDHTEAEAAALRMVNDYKGVSRPARVGIAVKNALSSLYDIWDNSEGLKFATFLICAALLFVAVVYGITTIRSRMFPFTVTVPAAVKLEHTYTRSIVCLAQSYACIADNSIDGFNEAVANLKDGESISIYDYWSHRLVLRKHDGFVDVEVNQ